MHKGTYFILPEQEKKIKFNNNLKSSENLIATTSNPITSIGTGLIPFVEHNDANRTLMGANMQRQALPLIHKEIAQISTGIEISVTKTSQYTVIAKNSGIIKTSNTRKIILEKFIENLNTYENKSNLKKYKTKIKRHDILKVLYCQKEKYNIKKIKKSNQNNYLQQDIVLGKNSWAKKGQLVSEGNCVHKGHLTLGRNLLIGYMSWEGYNFEDAVVINKKLIDKDMFTSISTKREKLFIVKDEKEEVRFRNNGLEASLKLR